MRYASAILNRYFSVEQGIWMRPIPMLIGRFSGSMRCAMPSNLNGNKIQHELRFIPAAQEVRLELLREATVSLQNVSGQMQSQTCVDRSTANALVDHPSLRRHIVLCNEKPGDARQNAAIVRTGDPSRSPKPTPAGGFGSTPTAKSARPAACCNNMMKRPGLSTKPQRFVASLACAGEGSVVRRSD